ncbi:6-phosphofructokinase [Bacillus sp. UNC41MFS5]|uniref:6-phosphofructokinase n=1 Tax=Bacillus sp. UNC41MFS5 TaxID=1449046 RepID=UPI00047E1C68|nr:6-phosphofructokinase [Bacillus sp. UNC41MFS5]
MNEKKVGIVKVGTIPQVVSTVINRLVYRLQKQSNYHVTGIQTNILVENQLEYLFFKEPESGKRLCSFSTASWLQQYDNLVKNFDILYIFYNEEEGINLTDRKKDDGCQILFIPINIFSEQNPDIYHLGFDSAVNEVVNNILKVKDTAGSLLFSNKRLFLINIPGKKAGVFLKTSGAALQCEIVEEASNEEMQQVINRLTQRYQDGSSYALLLFNETITEVEIKEQISAALDLDFRSVVIDEAQCIGGYPTVSDRVYANELAEKMVQWAGDGHSFEIVRLERSNQIKIDSFK